MNPQHQQQVVLYLQSALVGNIVVCTLHGSVYTLLFDWSLFDKVLNKTEIVLNTDPYKLRLLSAAQIRGRSSTLQCPLCRASSPSPISICDVLHSQTAPSDHGERATHNYDVSPARHRYYALINSENIHCSIRT